MVDNNEKNKNKNIYIIDSNNKNYDDKLKNNYFMDKFTSLRAIAVQYDSSNSDEESNTKIITKISNNQNYRNKNEVVLTSDESVDSESDSNTESENNSKKSSCSYYKNDKNNSDDSEFDHQIKTIEKRSKIVFKPKGEFDDLPPIQDLKISVPEVLCDPIGEIAWTVEQMVVICPKPGKPTLNLDTILFVEKGQRALGHIFDVFGKVTQPYYCVRFNNAHHILECNIKIGMIVYYCPNTPYTSVVFLNELTKLKAVDELGEDEPPQFSDDEEEQAYLASIKNKFNNEKVKEIYNKTSNKRKRDWHCKPLLNLNKKYDNEINTSSHYLKPFYRTQYAQSQLGYQEQNLWHQYNTFSNNHWISQNVSYNEIQPYNKYLNSTNSQEIEISSVKFPQMQWNPHQLQHMNMVSLQQFPQILVPSFNLPPPPPPPPPLPSQNLNK